MIKNIIFDIGGVLTRLDFEKKLSSFGFPDEIEDRVRIATFNNPKLWNQFDEGKRDHFDIVEDMVSFDIGIEKQIRAFMKNQKGIISKFDYTDEWLLDLKKRGYKLYYLSNWHMQLMRDLWCEMDFLAFMDGGILSYRDHLIKPDPEIYKLILKRYELKASETMFVDDNEANVIAANEMGIRGVLFKEPHDVESILDK